MITAPQYVKAALAGLMLMLSAAPAASLPPERAAEALHGELAECLAFYRLLTEATARGEDEDLAIRYARIAAMTDRESRQAARHAGLTRREAQQRLDRIQGRMIAGIEGSFRNIGPLVDRLGDSCTDLVNDPEDRLRYWLRMQSS